MTIESHQKVDQLEAFVGCLSTPRDRTFARDLIAAVRKYGPTSGRMKWIDILIERAQKPADQQGPEQVKVGDFQGVYGLFAKAALHLRFPKIRLQLADGSPLVLSMAGPNSKHKGTINVTDGGAFPGNKWYGRVDSKGVWTKSHAPSPEASEVEAMLGMLATDPVDTAAEYGRLTGRCCFCDRPLKDEQSTAAGFGPTCAENYGLTEVRKHATPILHTENDE
jgi:hypothetical protein